MLSQVTMACQAFQVTEEQLRREMASTTEDQLQGEVLPTQSATSDALAYIRFCSMKKHWRVQVMTGSVRKNLYRTSRQEAVRATVGINFWEPKV